MLAVQGSSRLQGWSRGPVSVSRVRWKPVRRTLGRVSEHPPPPGGAALAAAPAQSPARRNCKPFVVVQPESHRGLALPLVIPLAGCCCVAHQMFVEGPRGWPFPSINPSFPWFDLIPDSSSLTVCLVFPSVQTQIMAAGAQSRTLPASPRITCITQIQREAASTVCFEFTLKEITHLNKKAS